MEKGKNIIQREMKNTISIQDIILEMIMIKHIDIIDTINMINMINIIRMIDMIKMIINVYDPHQEETVCINFK